MTGRRRAMQAGPIAIVLALAASQPLVGMSATAAAKAERCTIEGTQRGDVLRGTRHADVLCGRGGDDRISGLGAGDTALGGAGEDLLLGGSGKDRLKGGSGADRVRGQPADDALWGGPGGDRLEGGPGRDRLNGGGGRDRLDGVWDDEGGAGQDAAPPTAPPAPTPPAPAAADPSPSLTELAFTPGEIDTSNGAQTTTLRFRARDDVGVEAMSIVMRGPTPAARQLLFPGDEARISGDARDGVYQLPVTLGPHSAEGGWRVVSFDLLDGQAGTSYDYEELTALGFDAGFTQVGPGDETPPTLRGFQAEPSAIDVTDGGAEPLEFDVSLADQGPEAQSGLETWALTIRYPAEPDRAPTFFFFDPYGTFEYEGSQSLFFPPGPDPSNPPPPAAGYYEYEVTVTDLAGHQAIFSSGELRDEGFSWCFYNGPDPEDNTRCEGAPAAAGGSE